MSPSHAQLMFRSAAVFNVLAGLPILLAGRQMAALMGVDGVQETLLFTQITGLAIIGFGWGYWLAASAPAENRTIIMMGLALKLCFVTVAVGNWLSGTINLFLPALAGGDVVYSWLFWLYLRSGTVAEVRRL